MRRKLSYVSRTDLFHGAGGAGQSVDDGSSVQAELPLGRPEVLVVREIASADGPPRSSRLQGDNDPARVPPNVMNHLRAAKDTRSDQRPSDRDVRAVLLRGLAASKQDAPRQLIEEFWIPLSHERADVVEVNGLLSGFEIKSARDTLDRLPRQAGAFSAVFDRVSLVCDARHLSAAGDLIPDWWGVVVTEGEVDALVLRQLRAPELNPNPDHEMRLRLLWRSELAAALQELGVRPGRMDRAMMRRALHERASPAQLTHIVGAALRHRSVGAKRW
jgi:hypothetical protein